MAERRYTLLFFTAVLTAAAATYGVYRVLESTKASNRIPTQPVVVAAQDLPEGAGIDRLSITVANWPVPTIPAGAFTSVDSLAGRVTRVAVFKGEPIVPGRLAPAGTGPGLEVKITPGKRAMALKINDVAGISGLIQPNSRVDVLVTLREDNSRDKQIAKLFMSNMRVLSVGSQVQRGDDGKAIEAKSATLEVTPEEAERLAIATNQGSIQLVLRGYGDPDSIKTPGARSRDVLAQLTNAPPVRPEPPPRKVVARRPPPPPPPPPPVRQIVVAPPPPPKPDTLTVQVFRGSKVSEQKFEQDSSAQQDSVATATP